MYSLTVNDEQPFNKVKRTHRKNYKSASSCGQVVVVELKPFRDKICCPAENRKTFYGPSLVFGFCIYILMKIRKNSAEMKKSVHFLYEIFRNI